MAKQTINIGSAANDGTGDPLRTAMDKINDNFDEIYSSYIATGSITVGNSTVNTVISNTGGFISGNTTSNVVANSSIIKIGNSSINATANSSTLLVSNSTVTVSVNSSIVLVGNTTVNTSINSSSISFTNSTSASVVNSSTVTLGNSSINSVANSSSLLISNSTVTVSVNSSVVSIGNSTVNTFANSSSLVVRSANVVTNTFNVGSYTDGANGYTYLPNGFKLNWGWVSANSTDGNVTFTAAYTTNAYVVTATSNTTVNTYQAAVLSVNNTVALIRTGNATSTNVRWTAIGL